MACGTHLHLRYGRTATVTHPGHGCEANRRYSAQLLEPKKVEEQRAAALGACEHLAAYRKGGPTTVLEPEQIPSLEWD